MAARLAGDDRRKKHRDSERGWVSRRRLRPRGSGTAGTLSLSEKIKTNTKTSRNDFETLVFRKSESSHRLEWSHDDLKLLDF